MFNLFLFQLYQQPDHQSQLWQPRSRFPIIRTWRELMKALGSTATMVRLLLTPTVGPCPDIRPTWGLTRDNKTICCPPENSPTLWLRKLQSSSVRTTTETSMPPVILSRITSLDCPPSLHPFRLFTFPHRWNLMLGQAREASCLNSSSLPLPLPSHEGTLWTWRNCSWSLLLPPRCWRARASPTPGWWPPRLSLRFKTGGWRAALSTQINTTDSGTCFTSQTKTCRQGPLPLLKRNNWTWWSREWAASQTGSWACRTSCNICSN